MIVAGLGEEYDPLAHWQEWAKAQVDNNYPKLLWWMAQAEANLGKLRRSEEARAALEGVVSELTTQVERQAMMLRRKRRKPAARKRRKS